jgi:hypothetical protein
LDNIFQVIFPCCSAARGLGESFDGQEPRDSFDGHIYRNCTPVLAVDEQINVQIDDTTRSSGQAILDVQELKME